VLVDRPDKIGRAEIVALYLERHSLAPDVSAEGIAALTPGFTGADLANLVNEAALVATRRNAQLVEMRDFTEAVERIVAGLEKRKRVLTPKERRLVAYHEMGHALIALSLPNADPVHKISIIPRGVGALGYTLQRPTEDRFVLTRDELLDRMEVLLGGRAAEWVMFQHTSTGAADDLAKATDLARDMVVRFGMEPTVGPVSYENAPSPFLGGAPDMSATQGKRYSDETARQIDEAVRNIVVDSFERAVAVLTARKAVLERGAKLLLDRETLDEEALKQIRSELQPTVVTSREVVAAGA
jgi:cell division protease FtsH